QRARQMLGGREREPEWRFGAHRLGAGQLLQPLHPRLCLLGLAGLGLEAVDELLQMLALDLFALVGDLLLPQLFGALALEARVITAVQLRPAVVQVDDMAADAVEELAVV